MEPDPMGLNAEIGKFTHIRNVLDLCATNVNAIFCEGEDGTIPFGICLVRIGHGWKAHGSATFVEEPLRFIK
jgi:hypothetical protein